MKEENRKSQRRTEEILLNEQLSQANTHHTSLQRELSLVQQSHSTTLVLVEGKAIQVKIIKFKN